MLVAYGPRTLNRGPPPGHLVPSHRTRTVRVASQNAGSAWTHSESWCWRATAWTGQELLVQALRVLASDVIGLAVRFETFDLSLANRRATDNYNGVVHDATRALREVGLGIKAATATPEHAGDVGSPNRWLREGVGGKVIIRTGRRIPGVAPLAGVHHPISVVRMAVGDAYGAEEGRSGVPGASDEVAYRTERISRSVCRAVAETAFITAATMKGRVYGGPKWTVSPVYEGLLKEEMDEAAAGTPPSHTSPSSSTRHTRDLSAARRTHRSFFPR